MFARAHLVCPICHSMGGFVTCASRKQHAHIKRIAYIATPHFDNPLSCFELNPEIRNVGFADFYEKAAITNELRFIVSGHMLTCRFHHSADL